MTRKAHDHLHRLIRSMDKSEKRYFKLYAGKNGGAEQNNATLLFDAVAAMDVYDEAFLLEKYKKQPFANHFAITKRRLYELLLHCLDAYHANSSVYAKLYRMLHQVELLHGRALYEDAAKILSSTRKLARQHDRQAVLIAVLQWERKFIETTNYSTSKIADLDLLAAESEAVLLEQTELDKLWNIKSRVLMDLYRQGQTRRAKDKKELEKLLDLPLLKKPSGELRTAKAKFLHHHIKSAAAFANGDLIACKKQLTANFELLTKEREPFEDESNLVLSTLSNLIYVHVRTGAYDDAHELLQRFRTIPAEWNMPETEDLDLKLFSTTNSLELTIHAHTGEFEKAVEMIAHVERGLEQHDQRMGPVRKAGFYYQIAYAYFGAGQLEKALKWTNRLLNDVRIDESAEVVCFGRMLNLIVHLELEEMEQITYALRSTERFLATRQRAFQFEPHFIALMHAALKAKNKGDLQTEFQRFHDAMLPLENDPLEHAVFDHLDPIAWVQSKLIGLSFAELVKQRAVKAGKAA